MTSGSYVGWRRKAAYALGSFATLAPDGGRSVFYIVVSAIALVGVLLQITRPSWLRGAGSASLIPLSLALAHFAVLVIFFPTVYGDRSRPEFASCPAKPGRPVAESRQPAMYHLLCVRRTLGRAHESVRIFGPREGTRRLIAVIEIFEDGGHQF